MLTSSLLALFELLISFGWDKVRGTEEPSLLLMEPRCSKNNGSSVTYISSEKIFVEILTVSYSKTESAIGVSEDNTVARRLTLSPEES
nr:hypothetical protein HmN_000950800 [Hymenolepis microstoma]